MEFDKVIKERYSVRSFKRDVVSDELINKILEAGRLAPTAKNNQPQRIYVIKSKEGLNKIDMISPCRYNAPVVLLVCSNKEEAFSNENFSTYEMDASIVATHLMLSATNNGVDNIWIEMFDRKKAKEVFNLPSYLEPICLLPMGYKSDDVKPSPMHNKRKELNEFVSYI